MVIKQKSAWKKNNRREVKKTIGRFIAILAITMLGVGFFAGLKVTKEAMLETGEEYIAENNLFDFRMISTYGLYDEDVKAVSETEGVKFAEGVQTMDFLGLVADDETVNGYKAFTITNDINKLSLVSGRLPENADECIVDALKFNDAAIGQKVKVSKENDKDTLDAFSYEEYTIVGLANSAYFLNTERGTTSIGNGSVTGFIYFMSEGMKLDYYSEIYVKVDTDAKIYSDEYNNKINDMKPLLEDVLDKCADRKYNEVYDEAEEKITDAEKEYSDGLSDYESEKKKADDELDAAWEKLTSAKTEISNKEKELSDGKEALNKAESDYEAGISDYNTKLKEYNDSSAETYGQLEQAETDIDTNKANLETQLEQLNQAYAVAGTEDIAKMIEEVKAGLTEIEAAKTALDQKKSEAEAEFSLAKGQLDSAKSTLDAAKNKIATSKKSISAGEKAITKAKQAYEDGLFEYNDNKTEADKKFADAEQELSDAKEKIEDGKQELADISEPVTCLLDRDTNVGYASFENDSSIVEGISKVFPIFFFMVAALVCITTMTRMVDEQRTQIGTLKALGYSNIKIAMKYMSYSGSAALIGCVIGFLGGSKLFPWAIWQVYGLLYNFFAPIKFVIDVKLIVMSIIVSLICSVGATWSACNTELVQMPAELMRPKTPKVGKKIWMEHLPFVWKNMKFLHKVSARNIFRFKKRMLMMLLGIGGCTALIVTGFGVSDSISNIAADQYDNIMKYDYSIVFDDSKNDTDISQFKAETEKYLDKCVFIGTETVDAIYSGGTKKVNIMAASDKEITDIIGLSYKGKTVSYPKDGEAIISNGLAKSAGVKVGDVLTLKINDMETKDVKISGIFQNYVYHYMFMTEATYKEIFGKTCEYKTALAVAKDRESLYETSADISNRADVATISVTNDFKVRVKNMLSSLNYVVALVIACACALAFVVLYNLSNINITERVREIATIKVLGFYPLETNSYVFRENIVLTIMGTIIGLPAGMLLHRFVMGNIKIDMVSFMVRVLPRTYFLAIVITMVMAVLVDLFLIKKINKISMTESLKSVE